jgi:hypothetical protein
VDADYGVREMVTDEVDGFHARSPDEATYLASRLAFEPRLLARMAGAGRETLMREHCDAERCIQPFLKLFNDFGE